MIRMSSRIRGAAVLLVVVAACAGCDRKGAKSGGDSATDPAHPALPAAGAWTKAGLTVSAFTKDQTGAIGNDCQSGTVSGLDVVVCKFPTEQAAKGAESKGLAWVGEATGASVASGLYVLAVVDRRKADPSGRTINQIIKLFRGSATTK